MSLGDFSYRVYSVTWNQKNNLQVCLLIHWGYRIRCSSFKLFKSILKILPGALLLLYTGFHGSAEDVNTEAKIKYGGDSYTVDYDREIIYAKGHAYFMKQNQRVNADRIEIYYAEDKQLALFFGNVVFLDQIHSSRIEGERGEVFFLNDLYVIEENAVYSDERARIKAERIESSRGEITTFQGNVDYTDGAYKIAADSLEIGDESARFRTGVEAIDIDTGDSIYCDSIDYFQGSGNITFNGDVVYLQKKSEAREDPLVIKADALRFFSEENTYLLLGNVLVLGGEIQVRSSTARYIKEADRLEAMGEVVVQDRKNSIYCDTLVYDVKTRKMVYSDSVKGILSTK
jgi:lipopolysaccharide export system protein LptA